MVRILIALSLAATAASPALADVAAGQKAFQSQCSICHAVTAAGKKIGPTLFGVVGRTSGSLPGYSYSAAMKKAGLTWTSAELTTYLAKPSKAVPGTKMTFAGITDPAKLADVVEYVETLK